MLNLKVNGHEVELKSWKFPAGEVGVLIPKVGDNVRVSLILTMPTSDEIIMYLNVLDALSRQGVHYSQIEVHIPYLPYGRQDRACHEGESFALEVFGRLICSLPFFDKIYTKDVHSAMSILALERFGNGLVEVINQPQSDCAKYLPKHDALIAPDKGAASKAITHFQVAALGVPCFTILKERKDGQVTYVDFPFDTISGKVCVVDDICDGGATFLALAEMLYRTQPEITQLNLYVTHGIFSKGVEELLKKYATIYVHNNMNQSVADSVTVI